MDNWITNPGHPIHIAVDPLGLYENQEVQKSLHGHSASTAEAAVSIICVLVAAALLVVAMTKIFKRRY